MAQTPWNMQLTTTQQNNIDAAFATLRPFISSLIQHWPLLSVAQKQAIIQHCPRIGQLVAIAQILSQ